MLFTASSRVHACHGPGCGSESYEHATGARECVRLMVPAVLRALQPKDWSISMNKKERRLALATALQSAASSTITARGFKVRRRQIAHT